MKHLFYVQFSVLMNWHMYTRTHTFTGASLLLPMLLEWINGKSSCCVWMLVFPLLLGRFRCRSVFLTSFASESWISILSVGMTQILDLLNLLNRIGDDEMMLQNWDEEGCQDKCVTAAFLKLWSADHKWSSGSALVVLLGWTLVQKRQKK